MVNESRPNRPDPVGDADTRLMEFVREETLPFGKFTLDLTGIALHDGDLTSQIDLSWLSAEMEEPEIPLVLSAKLHLRHLFGIGFPFVVIDPYPRQPAHTIRGEQNSYARVIGEGLTSLERARCYTGSKEQIFKRTLELADSGVVPVRPEDEVHIGYLTRSIRRLAGKKPFLLIQIHDIIADIYSFSVHASES